MSLRIGAKDLAFMWHLLLRINVLHPRACSCFWPAAGLQLLLLNSVSGERRAIKETQLYMMEGWYCTAAYVCTCC